jgi:hypothetical protein
MNFKRTHAGEIMNYELGNYEGDRGLRRCAEVVIGSELSSCRGCQKELFSTISLLFPPIIPQNSTQRLISLQLVGGKSIFAQSL